MRTIEELEAKLSEPSEALIRDVREIKGDILLLGIGGKMGPSLARLLLNAIRKAGADNRVIGVSRFSEPGLQAQLEKDGVETIACDLLDDQALQALPEAPNVIYMAGTKFGTTGNESFTWAMNAYLPGLVAEKFRHSRIVVFSSGNVYPFTPVGYGGASESQSPSPVGEYGQSCLGRERVFEHFSKTNGTPMLIYRLNYAIDMRYGVLLEVARSVKHNKPINLTMGYANVIWQGDANEIAIRSLLACEAPAAYLNVTGPETVSIRWAAEEFGKRFGGVQPIFEGVEASDALLNNAAKCQQQFGYPKVPLLQMIDWVADWVEAGGATLNKPTHFGERKGKF
ncbi:NAD-dependent epimerase/dehydratase family protein [Paenibacillus albus]|uniref:NAD(P)-dependent oxidoreductase n=1 Tax=Paenibacillus albus TaxID=2495582 RepID=A0A3S9A9D5_9BACL|nr:NAD(P)-dependent oxidoreductase [Paenibacillus albus]AZN42389.1 NAD(P)-dependent oxidoreductase [Paenibacillus albus]